MASALHDLDAAQARIERALELKKAAGDSNASTARSLHSLGLVLSRRGDLSGARERWEAVLQVCEAGSLQEVSTLSTLGTMAEQQGDKETARGHLRRAMAIVEAAVHGRAPHRTSGPGRGLPRRGLDVSARPRRGSLYSSLAAHSN